ncbi:glutamate synthase subunit beta [Metallibacterium scheffleri]|uniref:glutamate synthase subunit beta n=1 Tax=Metallibacterium scheffleri TaxID=993689 RepID=UPI0023F13FB2|nr:glutamate synthase subunit beta [Metallibacterium scheffleri]
MGKPSGFLDCPRQDEPREAPATRVRHWREFTPALAEPAARTEAARCMDCGIPFCHNGCPVHNLIPDFNDRVCNGRWREALDALHATNNFPEFTGRVCPAPCEAACTLGIHAAAVGIKAIEHAIIDTGWAQGWVQPQPAHAASGRRVAVVGSGPAGLAAAQQLARAGHAVSVFERQARPGGLLRYGIPDFKLDKALIDRRLAQLEAEGVVFRCGVEIGAAAGQLSAAELLDTFDAVLLAVGAEQPRDLPIPGRALDGIHFAMDFLRPQNQRNAGAPVVDAIDVAGQRVVVIGGGDTGSDCVGTCNRQGARSVTQFELLAQPPVQENKPLVWPYWPIKLRTSSSHEEGCARDWAVATQAFLPGTGAAHADHVRALRVCRVAWRDGRMHELPESSFEIEADCVLLALGFVHPRAPLLQAFGVTSDARGHIKAEAGMHAGSYATSVPCVYAAGDARRGQSLVVWAIREGREAARAIDVQLRASTLQPC